MRETLDVSFVHRRLLFDMLEQLVGSHRKLQGFALGETKSLRAAWDVTRIPRRDHLFSHVQYHLLLLPFFIDPES